MRIALVGEYPVDPKKISGGPQSVFVYLLEGLKEIEGIELHVISCLKQVTEESSVRRENVEFTYLPHPRLPFEVAYPILKRRVHRTLLRIRPDLVHAQQLLPVFAPFCMRAGCPTVATAHAVPGTEQSFELNVVHRVRRRMHEEATGRTLLPRIRHIICINEHIRKGLEHRTGAAFYPVDNPVSQAFFDLPSTESIRNRLLYVGHLR